MRCETAGWERTLADPAFLFRIEEFVDEGDLGVEGDGFDDWVGVGDGRVWWEVDGAREWVSGWLWDDEVWAIGARH